MIRNYSYQGSNGCTQVTLSVLVMWMLMLKAEEKEETSVLNQLYQRFSPSVNEIIMKFNYCRHGNTPNDPWRNRK